MSQIVFDTGSYDRAGRALVDAGAGLRSEAEAFLGSVSDLSALGTNDLLGGVCQAVYAVALEAVTDSALSAADSYEGFGEKLAAAGEVYRELESQQAAAGTGMVS